jgi:hypothetical protein
MAAADAPHPPPAPPPEPAAPARPATAASAHRTLVAVLLSVATITTLVAMFAVWVNRQALNTDNWTKTSSRLLADPKIQSAMGTYLVDQIFSNVDVAGELQSALPKQAAGLAGPAADGLRELANRSAPQVLARPKVQDAWEQANRAAHKQLLVVLNGGRGGSVSTANGQVTLDVRALITQLAADLGFQQQLAAARQKVQGSAGAQGRNAVQQKLGITLPASAGKIVILRSDQLKAAQDVAQAIRPLAWGFALVSFALFALAIWLAPGRRREVLRTIGWCLVGLGILVLAARRVGGNQLVDSLVSSASLQPAVHDAWTIGTSMLYDIAAAAVFYGVFIVAAAWLAGPTRAAVAVRRALAPALRYRLGTVYGIVALLYLLVLLWGPTPATTKLVGILLLGALIVLGIEVLRRRVAVEFPDAQPGDTMRRLRARRAGRAGGPARSSASIDQLERLEALHDRGALDEAEFTRQKTLLLDGR